MCDADGFSYMNVSIHFPFTNPIFTVVTEGKIYMLDLAAKLDQVSIARFPHFHLYR